MAIYYDIYKNPPLKGETETGYNARAVSTTTISTLHVKRYIEETCSLTSADVISCLEALSHMIKDAVQMGARVNLEGIGTFGPQIEGEVVKNKKGNFELKNGRLRSIAYTPDGKMLRHLRTQVSIEKTKTPNGFSKTPNIEEAKALLEKYFETEPAITARTFRWLGHVSHTLAYRILNQLLKENYLDKYGNTYIRKRA